MREGEGVKCGGERQRVGEREGVRSRGERKSKKWVREKGEGDWVMGGWRGGVGGQRGKEEKGKG